MAVRIDLTGACIGRWSVLSRNPARKMHWWCRCECGTVKSVFHGSLRDGTTTSCGCLVREMIIARNRSARLPEDERLRRKRENTRSSQRRLRSVPGQRDKERASARAAYAADPYRARDKYRRWRSANADVARAATRAWTAANPNKVRANTLKRAWRCKSAHGSASDEQIEARIAYFGNACAYCGGLVEHVDHAIPLSQGGTNWPANLRPACEHCNLSKGPKSVFLFLMLRPRKVVPMPLP